MIIFISLLACSDKDLDTGKSGEFSSGPEDTAIDTDANSTDDTGPTYLEEGTWAFSGVRVTDQTCGFPEDRLEQLEVELMFLRYEVNRLIEENYTFTLELEGNAYPNTCYVNGVEFSCEDFIIPIPVRDSTITETYTISGIVDSNVRINGSLNKHHECEGPDCAELAEQNSMTFPCDVTMDFTYNYFD